MGNRSLTCLDIGYGCLWWSNNCRRLTWLVPGEHRKVSHQPRMSYLITRPMVSAEHRSTAAERGLTTGHLRTDARVVKRHTSGGTRASPGIRVGVLVLLAIGWTA